VAQAESASDADRATAVDTDVDMADMEADEAMTRRALDLLGSMRNDAYEAALAALREAGGRPGQFHNLSGPIRAEPPAVEFSSRARRPFPCRSQRDRD